LIYLVCQLQHRHNTQPVVPTTSYCSFLSTQLLKPPTHQLTTL